MVSSNSTAASARTRDDALNMRKCADANTKHRYVRELYIELCKILQCLLNRVLSSKCGLGFDLLPRLKIVRKLVEFW